MKVHTTNYTNTFIEVAEDCPTKTAEMPPVKGDEKTIANMQFDLLYENPYKYDSDDVIFQCFANKQKLTKNELADGRKQFFSKGQPSENRANLSLKQIITANCEKLNVYVSSLDYSFAFSITSTTRSLNLHAISSFSNNTIHTLKNFLFTIYSD